MSNEGKTRTAGLPVNEQQEVDVANSRPVPVAWNTAGKAAPGSDQPIVELEIISGSTPTTTLQPRQPGAKKATELSSDQLPAGAMPSKVGAYKAPSKGKGKGKDEDEDEDENKMKLPPPTRKTLQHIMDSVSMRMSNTFDTAPALPRPLPPGYKYINLKALKQEAADAAPLAPIKPTMSIHTRRLQRLVVFYHKAVEFAHIHRRRHIKSEQTMKWAQNACLLLGAGSTVLLYVLPEEPAVVLAAGISVVVVSATNTWVKFARYEEIAELSDQAAREFTDIQESVEAMFEAVSDDAAAKLRADMAHLPPLPKKQEHVLDYLDDPDRVIPDEKWSHPNLEMQSLLRRCYEYRLAHALSHKYNDHMNTIMAFALLCISTVTGLLLFGEVGEEKGEGGGAPTSAPVAEAGEVVDTDADSSEQWLAVAAKVGTVVTTCIQFLNRVVDFGGTANSHWLAAKNYATMARELLTLLTASTEAEQSVTLPMIRERFWDLRNDAPTLPLPSQLKLLKREDKSPLFQVIIHDTVKAGETFKGMFWKLYDAKVGDHRKHEKILKNLLLNVPSWCLCTSVCGQPDDKPSSSGASEPEAVAAHPMAPPPAAPAPTWVSQIQNKRKQVEGELVVEDHDTATPVQSARNLHGKKVGPGPVTEAWARYYAGPATDCELQEGGSCPQKDGSRPQEDASFPQRHVTILRGCRSSEARVAVAGPVCEGFSGGAFTSKWKTVRRASLRGKEGATEVEDEPELDPKDFDPEAMEICRKVNLPRQVNEFGMRFSTAFENMPPVPRPLPKSYKYITISALLKEAEDAAPMDKVTDYKGTTLSQRQLARLCTWYCKATDFRSIHKECARKAKTRLAMMQVSGLVATSLITITLLLVDDDIVQLVAAVTAALVSLANSWLKFANYALIAAQHEVAHLSFAEVAQDIDALFAKLVEAAAKGPLFAMLEAVANASVQHGGLQEQTGNENWDAAKKKANPLLKAVTAFGTADQVRSSSVTPDTGAAAAAAQAEEGVSIPGTSQPAAAQHPGAGPVAEAFEAKDLLKAAAAGRDKTPGGEGAPEEEEVKEVGKGEEANSEDRPFTKAELDFAVMTTNPAFEILTPPEQVIPSMKLDFRFKLQVWYRKSVEYRLAHSLEMTKCWRRNDYLNLLGLVFTTATSIFLMLGSDKWMVDTAAVLSALASACAGINRFMDYSARCELHGMSVKVFSLIQRDLLTLIRASTDRDQLDRFDEYNTRFGQARINMPLLPVLAKLRDDEGKPLFTMVTDAALWKEADENASALFESIGIARPDQEDALKKKRNTIANVLSLFGKKKRT